MAVTNVTAEAESFTCNVFLVDGEQPTLVDAGAMEGVVEVVRRHVDTVDRVVLTHQHGDHVARLDAVVDAFAPEVHALADHSHRTHALTPGESVRIGDEAYEVLATPGHADDHVSFVSADTLFSGDVVVHDDGAFTGGSFGRTDGPDQSREQLIESLHHLLDRMPPSVEWLYAGHGESYKGDVQGLVERALRRAKRREPKYPDE